MKSFRSIIQYLRLWGFNGLWHLIKLKIFNWKMERYFLGNAKKYPLTPKCGITIIADLTLQTSLSKVMRDLIIALNNADIPYQTFDLRPKNFIDMPLFKDLLTPEKDFRTLKYNHIIEMFSTPFPKSLKMKRARIVFWEFSTGLLEHDPEIGNVDTVIAMSDFNKTVFQEMLPQTVNVKKILYPFFFEKTTIPDKLTIRSKFKIPNNAFTVLYNFDYRSSFNRKNPDGAIQAFTMAFADVQDTYLIFKTNGLIEHQEYRDKLIRLAQKLGISDRLIMIDDFISQNDIYGLTNACDIYLSLHRGEGFGLGIVEAMSLGKPVIATDYSSTTEFCKAHTSIPIPYTLVDIPSEMRDHPTYNAVKKWAEPDINAASKGLIKLYKDAELRENLGNAAKQFVSEYFSRNNFKSSIEAFLK